MTDTAPRKKAAAKKKPAKPKPPTPKPPAPSPRPYTGFDGYTKGVTPGLRYLVDSIVYLTGGRLWNNGTWGPRPIRGGTAPSVHGTGRAVDLSWRQMRDGKRNGTTYPDACRVIDWLVKNEEVLGLEIVIDYWPRPWGRGWRCDRERWNVYDRKTVSLAPGGDWFHLEISPAFAHDLDRMKAAVDQALRNP